MYDDFINFNWLKINSGLLRGGGEVSNSFFQWHFPNTSHFWIPCL